MRTGRQGLAFVAAWLSASPAWAGYGRDPAAIVRAFNEWGPMEWSLAALVGAALFFAVRSSMNKSGK
jgi:hypothetical protein